ncbi:MAG: ABC transporter permease [Candidatus Bipolaricaulia bacterium]
MQFWDYLARRLVYSIAVLFGLSIMIFLIARVMPGDPARLALGPRAPEEVVNKLREKMYLDRPFIVQYYFWITGALRGDFGESLYTRRQVADDVKAFLPATLELVLFAGVVMAVTGILLGILAARYRDTWVDNTVRLVSYVGVVTPTFVFAILFLLLFALLLDLLPTVGRLSPGIEAPPRITGMITIDGLITGHFAAVGDALKHLLLPGISLAMASLAQTARITRSSMTDHMSKEYIEASRSYGIPDRMILFKYLLKPSLIPTVTILGLDFAALVGNAFVVELVYNWPGLSKYGILTMLRKDLNAISAVVMVVGIVFITVNLFVDILVSMLDPRIRLETK